MTAGFIVSAWDERARGRRVFATGRLADGRSFAVVMRAPAGAVYVEAAPTPGMWTSFDGRPLARFDHDQERRLTAAAARIEHVEAPRAS